MCTVSFIPLKKGVILTSSRDEHTGRGPALYPDFYENNGHRLIFPKDRKAGGTWIVSNENGDAAILLNGAFKQHHPMPVYRKSRGLMLLDLFSSDSLYEKLCSYNFSGIENFTLILWHNLVLREIRWDGIKLKERRHDPQLPHIWSSATLYSDTMIEERHGWFRNWIIAQGKITQQDILDFHLNTEPQNKEYGLRISRSNKIFTASVTSICLNGQLANFKHYDLVQGIESTLEYDLKQVQFLVISTTGENEIAQKN
jgi:hypothetical protein